MEDCLEDLVGTKYYAWDILGITKRARVKGEWRAWYRVRCECGVEEEATRNAILKEIHSKHCGCKSRKTALRFKYMQCHEQPKQKKEEVAAPPIMSMDPWEWDD